MLSLRQVSALKKTLGLRSFSVFSNSHASSSAKLSLVLYNKNDNSKQLSITKRYLESATDLDISAFRDRLQEKVYGCTDEERAKRFEKFYAEAKSSTGTDDFVKDRYCSLIDYSSKTDPQFDKLEDLLASYKNHNDAKLLGIRLMALYYIHNQVDRALKNALDFQQFGVTLASFKSIKILTLMLFNNGRYQDVIDYYNAIKDDVTVDNISRLAHRLSLELLMAHYALNNDKSLEAAVNYASLIPTLNVRDENLRYRIAFTVAAILYKKGDYERCLMALSLKQTFTSNQLKIMALAKAKRFDDMSKLAVRQDKLLDETKSVLEESLSEIQDSNIVNELKTKLGVEHSNPFLYNTIDEYTMSYVRKLRNQEDFLSRNRSYGGGLFSQRDGYDQYGGGYSQRDGDQRGGFSRQRSGFDQYGGNQRGGGYDQYAPRDRNFGDRNFGDRNFGDRNFGDRNLGDRNFVDRNFGDRSFGDRSFRDRDSGDRNFGGR